MTTAAYWATLSEAEQQLLYALCMPSMRTMPTLLTRRYRARQAGLANREIVGPHARHIEYMRWLVTRGRMGDG